LYFLFLTVAGKTNFALSCAMYAALSKEYGGNGSNVVYISTDHAFPINRFMTLLECYQDKYPSFQPFELLERVMVQELSVRDLADFERILLHVIPALLDLVPDIKLIVIDSIAYNFRSEQNSAVDRASKLVEIGRVLKNCAAKYQLAVLLINQVTDTFDHDLFCTTSLSHGPNHWIRISLDNFELCKRPALGLSWSNCVNTRCIEFAVLN
jgi:RecA/RadA recombinase